ncbi:MAG: hypothetical protein ACXWOL_18210 [Ktedonobacteraceae bacterium]
MVTRGVGCGKAAPTYSFMSLVGVGQIEEHLFVILSVSEGSRCPLR